MGRESLTHFGTPLYQFFLIGNDPLLQQNLDAEMDQATTPQVARHRPPTGLKLAAYDSVLSGAYTLEVLSAVVTRALCSVSRALGGGG